ncbi:MAG TPA: serine hydrolase domain-containing protein [Candidatus Limnocylindria bacterium]|nr:serine hydrolase domain-containing protein [Candidatus Limnocylindria bacterium]
MSDRFDRVAASLAEAMDRWTVPGAALGIVHEGRRQTACFGVTSALDPLPVHDDTFFQIGSTTKTMTATVAVRLAAEGRLDLDAPLRRYVPELRLADEDAAARVSMTHILTHSGGWLGDFFENTGRGDDALATAVQRLADLPHLTPVGSEWHYLNSGFYLAGRVIEIVTGMTFEAAMRELLFEPLGMRMTKFFPEEVIAYRVAVGHYVRDGVPEVVRQWALHRSAHAAGGAISTVGDQLTYAELHLGDGIAPDGRRVLERSAAQAMRAPVGPRGAVGLSWWLRTVDGTTLVSHGGTTAGQQSAFVLVPERGFGITLLTNSSQGHAAHRAAVRLALREYCGLDDRDPASRRPTLEEARPFLGRWMIARTMLELRSEGDEVLLVPGPRPGVPPPPNGWPPYAPPARCGIVDRDTLVVLEGPGQGNRVELVRGTSGAPEWLRFGLRLYAPEERADRYPARGGGLVS